MSKVGKNLLFVTLTASQWRKLNLAETFSRAADAHRPMSFTGFVAINPRLTHILAANCVIALARHVKHSTRHRVAEGAGFKGAIIVPWLTTFLVPGQWHLILFRRYEIDVK